jgi:proteasome component ECM29
MAASSEARELDLVGKVEMRIALAKDDKLESMLKTYLPPLLLKLASDHIAVRNRVRNTWKAPRDEILIAIRLSLPVSISKCA